MSFKFEVSAPSIDQLWAAVKTGLDHLTAKLQAPAPVVGAPVTTAQAADMNPPAPPTTPLEQAIAEAPAKPEPKKRGPKPKVKIEDAGGDPNFPIISTNIDVLAPKVVTKDDARAALKAFTEAKNMEAGINLLREFGADSISSLDVAKYGEFVAACNARANEVRT